MCLYKIEAPKTFFQGGGGENPWHKMTGLSQCAGKVIPPKVSKSSSGDKAHNLVSGARAT